MTKLILLVLMLLCAVCLSQVPHTRQTSLNTLDYVVV
ncbi:hypothetical protein EGR_10124 [Echinococcus granulosus]|uniref:Uncharacterized protein n=1 Tax=Echinococcus granulosus TaxID=6210 RepID=W6U391_ECHGR|nr:hypothetical protein EGR_10124 [Echinococcus granulosus]EUB55006.1 hypothetical protein EGR_10124 [Echinococcus granulosus]